jgi:hypothetical protein
MKQIFTIEEAQVGGRMKILNVLVENMAIVKNGNHEATTVIGHVEHDYISN